MRTIYEQPVKPRPFIDRRQPANKVRQGIRIEQMSIMVEMECERMKMVNNDKSLTLAWTIEHKLIPVTCNPLMTITHVKMAIEKAMGYSPSIQVLSLMNGKRIDLDNEVPIYQMIDRDNTFIRLNLLKG